MSESSGEASDSSSVEPADEKEVEVTPVRPVGNEKYQEESFLRSLGQLAAAFAKDFINVPRNALFAILVLMMLFTLYLFRTGDKDDGSETSP